MSLAEPRSPRPPESLVRVQTQFAAVLDDGPTVDATTAELELAPLENCDLLDALAGPEAQRRRRLDVYRAQVWARFTGVLEETHPLLLRLVGLAEFRRLSVEFLRTHRPTTPQLQDLGEPFAEFLVAAGEVPILVECARLERAYERSFLAAWNAPLGFQDLQPEALALSVLRLQPALEIFEEHHDLVRTRLALLALDEEPAYPALARRHWAIWQHPERGSSQRELEPLEAQLLGRFTGGATLEQALGGFTANEAEEQAVASKLGGWFHAWAEAGWLTR